MFMIHLEKCADFLFSENNKNRVIYYLNTWESHLVFNFMKIKAL